MRKRQKEADDAYEAQWNAGKGSHHPDYDPYAMGDDIQKASRQTEELYNAIVKNDIKAVYKKIEEGADVNFTFGRAYQCWEGYTPLMVACHRCIPAANCHLHTTTHISCQLQARKQALHHMQSTLLARQAEHCPAPTYGHCACMCRGRLECVKALLRAGADPNYMNAASDLTLFWGIDGGVEIIKLLIDAGADLDIKTPKDWTPLSYCRAKGKYGATEEKGIYPEVRQPFPCCRPIDWPISYSCTIAW